jgi:diguanylate cyclase (GGDEF)-like protein
MRHGAPNEFSLAYFDIDHFKQFNDQFGHHRGDDILKRFVELLNSKVPEEAKIFRLGGDEFLLYTDSKLDLIHRLNAFMAEFVDGAQRHEDKVQGVALGCSIGLLEIKNYRGDPSLSQLIHRADQLMYTAKDMGKNRILQDQINLDSVIG